MTFSWLKHLTRRLTNPAPQPSCRRPSRRPRLGLEVLEDRTVLSGVTYNATTEALTANISAGAQASVVVDPTSQNALAVFASDVPTNGGLLFLGGAVDVKSVTVNLSGQNALTLGSNLGLPFFLSGAQNYSVQVNGVGTGNTLALAQAAESNSITPVFNTETVTPAGSAAGNMAFASGSSTLNIQFGAGVTLTDSYAIGAGGSYTINAPPVNGLAVNIAGSSSFTQVNSNSSQFDFLNFANKSDAVVVLAGGNVTDDSATINLTAASPGLKTIQIEAQVNTQTLNIEATPAGVTAIAQTAVDGNEENVNIGNSSGSLQSINGDVQVLNTGTSGTEPNVNIFDQGDTQTVTYTVGRVGLTEGDVVSTVGGVSHNIDYNSGLNVILSAEPSQLGFEPIDDVTVLDTAPGSSLTIYTNDPNNTDVGRDVRVLASDSPVIILAGTDDQTGVGSDVFGGANDTSTVNLDGPLTVEGGRLLIDDVADTLSGNYSISQQSVVMLTGVPITYANVGNLTLEAGNGKEDITVEGTNPSSSTFNGLALTVLADLGSNPTAGTNFHYFFNEVTDLNQPTFEVGSAEAGATLDFNNVDRSSTIAPRTPALPSGSLTATFLDGTATTVNYSFLSSVTAEPDADHSFVQSLFHNVLDRSGSQGELNTWYVQVPRLGQAGVAAAFNHTTEAYQHVVNGWFAQFLGEQPSDKELAKYTGELANGTTQEHVLAEILATPEFLQQVSQGQHESKDEAYVEALYSKLLNIPEDQLTPAQLEQGLDDLHHRARGLAYQLLTSADYRALQVIGDYGRLLNKAPTAQELTDWVGSDLDLLSIQIGIESTPEFFNNGR